MRGVCFEEIGKVITAEVDDPKILDPRDAIVEIRMAGLCGSDLHPFFGREKGLEPGTVMGHEFVGRIVETGSDVHLNVGDSVYAPFYSCCGECFYCEWGLTSRCPQGQLFGWRSKGRGLHGGQAELVRVPLANGTLVPIPDDLPDEVALLLGDNLSTGYYGAGFYPVYSGRTQLIVGCGTVGLCCVLSCIVHEANHVFAIDPIPQRLAIAESYGAQVYGEADQLKQALLSATDGRGADSVIELVGLPEAQRLAYELVRPGGVIHTIGCHSEPHFSFSPVEAYDKNLQYRTGRCPARQFMDNESILHRFKDRYDDLCALITHKFRLDESELAYDIFSKRKDGCVKAVFEIKS